MAWATVVLLGVVPRQSNALHTVSTPLNTSPTDADVQSTFSERVGTWTLCSTDGTEDLHEAKGEGYATYTNPLWPNGLDWMKLPPGTHLLLYGRGSMGAMSSALRAVSKSYGTLIKTTVVSTTRECADPTVDPRGQEQPTTCRHGHKNEDEGLCYGDYTSLGPEGAKVQGAVDPHSVIVDYLTGNSTITTISNHAQSQRLNAKLGDWLRLLAPLNGAANFTHGVFQDPHSECWFDQHCDKSEKHVEREVNTLALAAPGIESDAARTTPLGPQTSGGHTVEYCQSWSDADCPRRHPHFKNVERWVANEPAVVLLPPRLASSREIPFESDVAELEQDLAASPKAHGVCPNYSVEAEDPESESRTSTPENYTVPEKYHLKCVLEEQLAGRAGRETCPNGRNKTVWLAQAKLIYEYGPATRHMSSTCYCEHLCNARCVHEDSSGWSLSADECPAGQRNAAKSECLAAVQEAAQSAGEKMGSEIKKNKWDNGEDFGPMVPPGCSYSRSNKAAIYREPGHNIVKFGDDDVKRSDDYLRVCVHSKPKCFTGPGIAAVWLSLRAAGLRVWGTES